MYDKSLEENIKITTVSLLKLVEKNCWNKVSNNCLYILTDINELKYSDFYELRKLKQKNNSKKIPQNFNLVVKTLNEYFDDLYDVVLYVFKAESSKTIIEIEYLKKSDLDPKHYQKIKDYSPMFHAKIITPPHQNQLEKFDINWIFKSNLNPFEKFYHFLFIR